MSRRLTISIFRHNPRDPDSVPRRVPYELDELPGMTLFLALNAIRDSQAPDLNFDFVCRAGVCGTCETRVVSGEVEHRDAILNEAEKHSGDAMMICVSRAAAGCRKLTLEL